VSQRERHAHHTPRSGACPGAVRRPRHDTIGLFPLDAAAARYGAGAGIGHVGAVAPPLHGVAVGGLIERDIAGVGGRVEIGAAGGPLQRDAVVVGHALQGQGASVVCAAHLIGAGVGVELYYGAARVGLDVISEAA
jgi:hypothetical protein